MIKWIILLISLTLLYTPLFAQQTRFSGFVQTPDKSIIENAIIVVKNHSGYTIAYTKTDAKGFFKIELKKNQGDSLQICALMIGYAENCQPLLVSSSSEMVITLLRKELVLNEVIVKKTVYPVTISGDTTKYNLKGFTDGTESKLEDILKKLPGIRVDDAGSITFKGKKISKILVEGEDFFSKDYKLLSKNISAALIEKIEAIENYNEEDLLKDIQSGDESILNIGLNKNKLAVFGDITAGVGTDNNRLLSTNLFTFINKFKIGLINNYNTIGQDIKPDIQEQVLPQDVLKRSIFQGSERALPITHLTELNTNSITNRYTRAEPGVSALQFNTRITPSLTFKSYTTLKSGSLEKSKIDRTVFSDGVNTQSFIDSGKYGASPKALVTENNLDLRIDSTSKIRAQFNYSNNTSASNAGIYSTIQSVVYPSLFNKTDKDAFYTGKISYIKRLKNKSAIQLDYIRLGNTIQQGLNSNTDRYNSFLNITSTGNTVRQSATIEATDNIIQVQYFKKISKHQLNAAFVTDHADYSIESKLDYQNNNTGKWTEIDSTLFKNKIQSSFKNYSLELRDNIKLKRLFAEASLIFYTRSGIINNNIANSIDEQNNKGIFPSILMGYKLDNKSKLAFVYTQYNQFSTITDYTNSYIQSDISTFARNQRYYNTNKKTDFIAKYQYNNFYEKGLMFSGTITQSSQKNPTINTFQLLGSSNTLTRLVSPEATKSILFNFQLDQFLPLLKSTINFSTNILKGNNYDNPLVNNFKQNDLLNTQSGIGIQTGLKGPLNFGANFGYTTNNVAVKLQDNSVYKKVVNNNFRFGYKMSANISKSVFAILSMERCQWLGDQNATAFFGDFRLNATTKNKQWSFEFYCRNIFNSGKLYFNQVTPSYNTSQQMNILPRMAFISVNYKL